MDSLFTIILLHYNQVQFIYEALDSVLTQTYKNIELIISDDCSTIFDKVNIEQYVKNKRPEISLKFVINGQNLGTVKTLNKCLKKSTGDYVLIFAADDRLNNINVIQSFCNDFTKYKDRNVIAAQCVMCELNINKKNHEYIDVEKALKLNDSDALSQYKELAVKCIYAAGAVAYRMSVFEKFGYPSEEYMLIEDLTYWLLLTFNKEKIYYSNFLSLDHRDGGVSKNQTPTESVKKYYRDLALIYERQVIPNLSIFNKKDKKHIVLSYLNILNFLYIHIKNYKKKNWITLTRIYIIKPIILWEKLKMSSKKITRKFNQFLPIKKNKKRERNGKTKTKILTIKNKLILEKSRIVFYIFWVIINLITVFLYFNKTFILPMLLLIINSFLAKMLTFILFFVVRRLKNGH